MNDYDQASRHAAKLDPPGFLGWLLGIAPETVGFVGWLDARTIPMPGEPERTCDTVAELAVGAPVVRRALVLEFQTEPRGDMLDRQLEYLARLRRELRYGPDRQGKYQVVAAMVNLTGPEQPDELTMALPGTAAGLILRVGSRAMREVEAGSLLAEIATGRVARGLLPWIPLMHGAGDAAIIDLWKQVASREPDRGRRGTLSVLARVFAEKTDHGTQWQAALKEWDMNESPTIAGFRAEGRVEGRAEGRRADLVRVLHLRFPGQATADILAAIENQSDPDLLARWFDAAVTAPALADFLAATQPRH